MRRRALDCIGGFRPARREAPQKSSSGTSAADNCGDSTPVRSMHLKNFSLMDRLGHRYHFLLLRRDVNVMYTTSKSHILHCKTIQCILAKYSQIIYLEHLMIWVGRS